MPAPVLILLRRRKMPPATAAADQTVHAIHRFHRLHRRLELAPRIERLQLRDGGGQRDGSL